MDLVEQVSRVLAAIIWRQHLTSAQRHALGPLDATWRTRQQPVCDIIAIVREHDTRTSK